MKANVSAKGECRRRSLRLARKDYLAAMAAKVGEVYPLGPGQGRGSWQMSRGRC